MKAITISILALNFFASVTQAASICYNSKTTTDDLYKKGYIVDGDLSCQASGECDVNLFSPDKGEAEEDSQPRTFTVDTNTCHVISKVE